MQGRRKVWLMVWLLGLAGATVFVVLLVRNNVADIGKVVAAAGWGLLAVVAMHLVPLFLDSLAWRALFPAENRPGLARLFFMRWAGEAVGTLLPATQVGGDIVRARLAATAGVSLSVSAASVVADITVSVFAQILFTFTGLALLAWVTGRSGVTGPAVAGALLAILAVGVFYVIQRFGMFGMIMKLVGRITQAESWKTLTAHGENLDADIRRVYGRRRGVATSCLCTYASWMAGAVEVWIALSAIGMKASYANAVILESVGQGIRAAMFFVPGALGIQEAGYIGIGAVLGIPAEMALALSLIRRVRELAFGVPGLVGWQVLESRRALKGARSAAEA